MRNPMVFVLMFLVAIGCGGGAPTPTEIVPEPTATVEPTPEPVATFEEAPCPFDVPEEAAVECGFVVVPEDHNDPDGPTIRLATAIVRDQSPWHQPDPVILLAGGPGGDIVEYTVAVAAAYEPLHANRDFVVFDQGFCLGHHPQCLGERLDRTDCERPDLLLAFELEKALFGVVLYIAQSTQGER